MTDNIIRLAAAAVATMTPSNWAVFLAGSIAGMASLTWWKAKVLRDHDRG